jgi:ParB family chromosome partitioning protein
VAKIRATEELPVSELVISESQARMRSVAKEIDDLAESIRVNGLLEPIVVCPDGGGRYLVLMGQRRLLAHQKLGKDKILSAIIDEPVDQTTAKVLSLTENLIRQDLDARDVIDACTVLYKRYGNAKAVAKETGLPYAKVLRHVKYDRLAPAMQELVDSGEIGIDLALRAQDAVGGDEGNEREVVHLARSLASLTGAQQRQILTEKKRHPDKTVDDLLADTPWDARSKQIIVTLSTASIQQLQLYARSQGVTQDQAAAAFVVEGLAKLRLLPAQEDRRHPAEMSRTASKGARASA